MNKENKTKMPENRNKALFMALAGIFLIIGSLVFRQRIEGFLLAELRQSSYGQIASVRADILGKKIQAAKPLRAHETQDLIIQAPAAISIRIAANGSQKILFEKNSEQTLPIASLTKLMTALVAMENCNLNQPIVFSERAASMEGEANFFKTGEIFYGKDLLYSCLIESSNRAAQALAESLGEDRFVDLMNAKAVELGLENTHFINPTGLDPDYPNISSNFSSALDLARLSTYLFENDFFIEIAGTKEFDIYEVGKGFHHRIISTNELLWEMPEILFGKTGQTPFAKKCLLIFSYAPDNDGYLVSVILGSQDHFGEMKKMIDWAKTAYKW